MKRMIQILLTVCFFVSLASAAAPPCKKNYCTSSQGGYCETYSPSDCISWCESVNSGGNCTGG